MVIQFMSLVNEYQLLYNLVIIINTKGNGEDDFIVNQQNERVPKFGQTRLRSLELLNNIFILLHPSHGPLAAA